MTLKLVNKFAVVLILLFMGSAFAAFTIPHAFAQDTCPGSLPARLIVGQGGRVRPGGANNVRLNPSTNADRIGEIPSGETAVILEGPVCADGYTWWKVDYNGLNGWTPEGGDGEYWLEAIDLATGQPPIVIAEGNCEGSLPRRLLIGSQGRVRPRIPNNVRIAPGLYGDILGEIPTEGIFTILDGPVCGDDYTWWQVDYNGLIGWTAESGDGEYWLQMVDAPTVTPSPSATIQFVTETPRPTEERPLLYTVPEAFEDVVTLPVWTEPFDTLGPLSAEAGNAVGIYVNPIMDYTVTEGTLALAYQGMIKPIEWEQVIDTSVTEPMNQFVVSVNLQNLEVGDIYACAVIEINPDGAHNAIAMFCANNDMSLHYPRQLSTGNWEVRGPNAMDGAPHRVTIIADGTKMRLYVDGIGGVERPYTGTLETIGLRVYHGASGPDTISNLRFDNLEIGIPTNTLLSNPAITVTKSPRRATVVPTPAGSTTPTGEELRVLPYSVPDAFADIEVVPLWKSAFDAKAGRIEQSTITVYTDAQLEQSLDEGILSLSHTGTLETGDELTRLADTTIDYHINQYILSVDVQNLTPESAHTCVALILNPEDAYRATALFCKDGLVRLLLAGQRSEEWQDPAYDAMDGQTHRISVIADGDRLRLYVDGHGILEQPYQAYLGDLSLSLYNVTAEAETVSRLHFDNLEIGLPLACSIAITLTIDEVKAGYPADPYPPDFATEAHVEFSYGVHFPLFMRFDSTDVLWSFTKDFSIVDGTRLSNFPSVTRIMPCDEETNVVVSITNPDDYVEFDRVRRIVTANDLISYPETVTETLSYRNHPFDYEVTYTIDVQPADSSISLPDQSEMENVQIDYSEEGE